MARKTKKTFDPATGKGVIEVYDGEKVAGSVAYDVNTLPAPIKVMAMGHGIEQLLGDTFTSETNGDDAGTVADGLTAIKAKLSAIMAGQWSTKREGGGAKSGLTVEALAAVKFGGDMAKANAAWAKATEEQKKALRSHPTIRAKVADIQKTRATEAAKGAPSLDSLLA